MRESKIEWCDYSWNPVVGCTKVSEGCKFCYAERLIGRDKFSSVRLLHNRLGEPLYIKKPSIIFVNAISDFFHEAINDDFRLAMISVMRKTPQHIYQILTKRSKQMLAFCQKYQLPNNVWLGVSCESPKYFWRIDDLRAVKHTSVKFVSFEPLLADCGDVDLTGIHWVIVGGESGKHLLDEQVRRQRALVDFVNGRWLPRQDRIEWVRRLLNAARRYRCVFFFKQWGGEWHGSGGRELDGKTYLEFPTKYLIPQSQRIIQPSLF